MGFLQQYNILKEVVNKNLKANKCFSTPMHTAPSETRSVVYGNQSIDTQNVRNYTLESDAKTWNAIIRDYCENARHEEALSLFQQKIQFSAGFRSDYHAFTAPFKSCATISALKLGRALHGFAVKVGHLTSQAISKALINMYAKTGFQLDCQRLFSQMDWSDPVAWNIILSGYARSWLYDKKVMDLFYAMHICKEEPKPNAISVAIILPVCARSGDADIGRSTHAYAIKSGLETHTLVANALVSMYVKCGSLCHEACTAFRKIADKDVVSWNTMISGYATNGYIDQAFDVFRQMLTGLIEPDYATFVNILPVCAFVEHNGSYRIGKEIHCYVLRRLELSANVSVSNALVSFYSRVGRVEEAESLFRRIESRDIVSWNAIIAGYASNGLWSKALDLFHELLSIEVLQPNSVTIISVLPACAELCNKQEGIKIHEYVLRHPCLLEDTSVGNALISFYAKCNDVKAAFWTFSMTPKKDLISWNAMLDVFAESRTETQLVDLLHQMLMEGLKPDSITILTILHFCVNICRMEKVKEVQSHAVRVGLLLNDIEPTVGNAILDAYVKCGNMEYAFKTFESLSGKRNVVTCNSMISGYVDYGSEEGACMIFETMSEKDLTTWNLMVRVYAENDKPDRALILFHELQIQGMRPDAVTVLSLFTVCACLASVRLVRECHGYIVRAHFDDVQLRGALLDVYSKSGSINCAFKLFWSSRQKDLVMFTAMVSGFAMNGMGKEALMVFSQMLELGVKPDHAIITSVLSACSHAGLVDEGLKLFESLKKVEGIKPTMEHHACVVDLLARGGYVRDAFSFVTDMPMEANANIWGALLGACRTHHELELGCVVADHLFDVEDKNIGNYVVMSNVYADNSRWDGVKEVRKLMKMKDLRKPAGCSWIEVGRRRSYFVAGDIAHPQRGIIYSMLCNLEQQIKAPFYLQKN